jgi:hypothetical protein
MSAPTFLINLGVGRRIATGLDWVFDQVDRAIVLEDGCVPHPSFFGFCQELLDRHRIIDGSARSLAAIS